MARNIGADGSDVYRAVITTTDAATDKPFTWHEGPYAKPGAAAARVTFWANYHRDDEDGSTPTRGHVEQAHTVWAPIGQTADPIAAARAQAYRDAIEAARSEYLTDNTGTDEDEAYNRGIADAIAAIDARAAETFAATEEPRP